MDPPTYRYEPLAPKTSAIRILNVLSSDHGKIFCKLEEVRLDRTPKYTALSYTWDAQKSTRPITILDKSGKPALLCITPNLQSFLRQLLVNYPELYTRPKLWVDSMCINQSSKDGEKSAQVAMMQDIYQKAERVIIWLGEGTPQTNAGMDFIPQLVAAERRTETLRGDDNSFSGAHHSKPSQLGLQEYGIDEYMAFISLWKSAWFSRVWILQEVAMAKQVQLTCGTRSTSWDDFVKAFYFLNTLYAIIPDWAHHGEAVARVSGVILARTSRILGYRRDLLGLLLRCRWSLATNPRDKVFALLGLATDTGPDDLNYQANYDLEVQQVYTDVTFAIIKFEKNLDALGVPRGAEISTAYSLPSWVPDWGIKDITFALNHRDRPAGYVEKNETLIRNAACDTIAVPRLSSNRRMLGLQGYVFDEITEVGTICKSNIKLLGSDLGFQSTFTLWKQNIQAFLHWERLSKARSGETYPPTGETTLAAYWQTITTGEQDERLKLSSSTFLEWDSYSRPGVSLRRLVGSSIAKTSMYAWLTLGLHICKQLRRPPPDFGFDQSLNMSSNRRFVRSRKGYMGLVPAETRSGDAIALFKGGRSPLIIRSDGAENWKLVGDSYMHGMMSGECFREDHCQTLWLV